uniref:Uncharacterized protein n=1 Tax=Timema poppense TaxID=170557 RepID=A0A7R9CTP0_TIMPO|nr:unnamed protein product [Timema poppensis]
MSGADRRAPDCLPFEDKSLSYALIRSPPIFGFLGLVHARNFELQLITSDPDSGRSHLTEASGKAACERAGFLCELQAAYANPYPHGVRMSGEPNTSLNLATNEDQIRLLLLEGDVSDIEIDLEEDEGEEIIFSNKSNDESEQPENIQAVGLTIELDTAYDEDLDDVPLSERLSYATRRPSIFGVVPIPVGANDGLKVKALSVRNPLWKLEELHALPTPANATRKDCQQE